MLNRLRRWISRFAPDRPAEVKFRRIFEQSPDSVALLHWTTGRYVEVNRVLETLTGWRADEVIGRTPEELGLFAVPAEGLAIIEALRRDRALREHPYTVRTRAGALRQCRITASLVDLDGDWHVMAVTRDVTEELRAAAAQRASEERFARFFATMPAYALVARLDDGRIVEVNPVFEAMTGWSRAEAVGRTTLELGLITPQTRARLRAAIEATGAVREEPVELRRRDGTLIDGLLDSVRCELDGAPHLVTLVRDVSRRKAAERELRASEARFSTLFHELPSAVSLVRVADQKVVDINRSWEEFYGLDRARVLGQTSRAFDLWPDPARRDAFFHRLREHGTVREFEALLRCAGGEMRTLLLDGRAIEIDGVACWLLVGHDISARKAAEGAREESETLLRLALDAAQLGVWRRELPDGRLEWSAAMFRILGVNEATFTGAVEEYIGRIHSADRDRVNKEIDGIVSGEKTTYFTEHRVQRPDGSERWIEVRGRTIHDAAGRPARRVGTVLDITERKQAEVEVRRENLALEERVAGRTRELQAAIGELETFSYTVAHDLRAPLRAVAGFGAMLREDHGAQLGEGGAAMLDRMTSAAERLSEMIDALLELSRIMRTPLVRRRVRLSELAQTVADELAAAEPTRRVAFDITPGLEIEGDARLLRLVLENLLGNAWKYSSQRALAHIAFGTETAPAGMRAYFVRDDGAGFDGAYADKLFGVFQRLHTAAEFPGHGVGLSTVKRIIERHGGTVRAEGVKGEGASVYFTLPDGGRRAAA